jgi:DNA primase small subunit
MSELGNKIVTGLLKNYYKFHRGLSPDKVEQREFGFGTFESKIAFRHMAFKKGAELDSYLIETGPAFVDYSAAYYRYPDARPMERKEWLGSELRFDIDSNDIPTECKLDHAQEWVCDKCLVAAKEEVTKLIEDFLIPDFGFTERELQVNFSGNRGYHVHVRKDSLLYLGANAREEISSYVFGQEPDTEAFFEVDKSENVRGRQTGPKPTDGGWRGKVAKAFMDATLSKEDLTALGIDKVTASWIFRHSSSVKEQIAVGNWDFHGIPHRDEILNNLLQNQAIKQGNRIDKNVTRDPTHLMRLANTIHGGTGLVAKKLPSMKALDDFDPMKDAIAFADGELRVRVDSKYKLIINNQEFGPYKSQTLSLPTYAATYLYLKGLADIVSSN